MIQYKQPKKIKGARKKARKEVIERLSCKFPMWFDNKTEKEIRNLVNAFRHSGRTDDEFPIFCIEYERQYNEASNTIFPTSTNDYNIINEGE